MPRKRNEFTQERIEYARYHKTIEKQVRPYFRRALNRSIEPVLSFARAYGLEMVNPDAIATDIWSQAYIDVYQLIGVKTARKEYYRQKGLDAEKIDLIGFLKDVWSSTLRSYALRYTYQISRELNDTTINIIRKALGDVAALGLDRTGAIRLFEKTVKGEMRTRSNTISRTEATTISNLGKEIGARSWIDEQGGGGYKVWLGRADKRERKTHLHTNNIVLPIGEMYDLDGELCERPGDVTLSAKERINCRCTQSLMSTNRYNGLVKRGRIKDGKLVG